MRMKKRVEKKEELKKSFEFLRKNIEQMKNIKPLRFESETKDGYMINKIYKGNELMRTDYLALPPDETLLDKFVWCLIDIFYNISRSIHHFFNNK